MHRTIFKVLRLLGTELTSTGEIGVSFFLLTPLTNKSFISLLWKYTQKVFALCSLLLKLLPVDIRITFWICNISRSGRHCMKEGKHCVSLIQQASLELSRVPSALGTHGQNDKIPGSWAAWVQSAGSANTWEFWLRWFCSSTGWNFSVWHDHSIVAITETEVIQLGWF